MKFPSLLPLIATLPLVACSGAAAVDPDLPAFSKQQIDSLKKAVAEAPLDALPVFDIAPLDRALFDGDENTIRRTALDLAEQLARAHLHGCTPASERAEWYIRDTDDSAALRGRIGEVLRGEGKLEGFFADLAPDHPAYATLRAAYAAETDPERRLTLARNMERWRWLPRALGQDYVMVNVPAFEVYEWRGGAVAQTWRAVVGKTSTPTPQLAAMITGVTFNPWWDVPRSIAETGRFGPRGGYVFTKGGHIRQKPGPHNALGQMKVEMANSHAIYLHDTPSKGLFGAERRAFSHGCVRVGDPLRLAETLLKGVRSRDDIDVLTGNKPDPRMSRALVLLEPAKPPEIRTTNVRLAAPLPVYIAYFTAMPGADGAMTWLQDLYDRDKVISDPATRAQSCDTSGIKSIDAPPPKPRRDDGEGDPGP